LECTYAKKVTEEDLGSWALRIPPKYFFTFLVKAPKGGEMGVGRT
jgi:hypothetical protein